MENPPNPRPGEPQEPVFVVEVTENDLLMADQAVDKLSEIITEFGKEDGPKNPEIVFFRDWLKKIGDTMTPRNNTENTVIGSLPLRTEQPTTADGKPKNKVKPTPLNRPKKQ